VGKRADLIAVDASDRVALTLSAGAVIHANGTLALHPERQPLPV
jgi:hypothetical protein